MKSLIKYVLPVSICFILGCKKDSGKTTIEGIVFETSASNRVGGATVYLMAQSNDCLTCPVGAIKSTTTNNAGEFDFTFEAEDGVSYKLVAKKDKYFENAIVESPLIENGRKNKKKDLHIYPEGFIRLHVKNTQPFDGNDEIGIRVKYGYGGGYSFGGSMVDTTFIEQTRGNEVISINWFTKKDGKYQNYEGSVTSIKFDTVSFTLNY